MIHAAPSPGLRQRPVLSLATLAITAAAACDATRAGDSASGGLVLADAVELASPAAPGSGQPFLATAHGGGILMSWLEPAGDGSRPYALRFARWDGRVWSEPATITSSDSFFVNWADFPSILELPDGRLAAHWLARGSAGRYAYGVRIAWSSDAGATWSEPVTPHTDGTPTEHGFVSLFPLDGAIGAVWLDGRNFAGADTEPGGHGSGADMTLRAARVAQDGTLSAEHLIDARTCECCQTDVASATSGPVLAYRDRSPGEVRDIAITRFTDGRWTEPAIVHADGWVFPGCPVNGPAVAAAGDRLAVAWYTAVDERPRVRLAFSEDAGLTFGPPIEIDEGAPAGRTDLILLEDGTALVSWLEGAGDGASVRVRAVPPSGRPGPSVTVGDASAERPTGFPRMLRNGSDVLFAWTEPGPPSRVRVAALTLQRPMP